MIVALCREGTDEEFYSVCKQVLDGARVFNILPVPPETVTYYNKHLAKCDEDETGKRYWEYPDKEQPKWFEVFSKSLFPTSNSFPFFPFRILEASHLLTWCPYLQWNRATGRCTGRKGKSRGRKRASSLAPAYTSLMEV